MAGCAIHEVAVALVDLHGSTGLFARGCHKTFTPRYLYICHQDALPYLRAAAKASFSARLPSGGPLELRVPEDRCGCFQRQPGLEEESDTKCRNQRVP